MNVKNRMKKQTLVYVLAVLCGTAPLHAVPTEPRDITQVMVNKAAVGVHAAYKKSKSVARFALVGSIAGLLAIGYNMFGGSSAAKNNGQQQQPNAGQPEAADQDPATKGDMKDLKNLLSRQPEPDSWGSRIMWIGSMMGLSMAVGYGHEKIKGWFMGPERFRSMDAFKDSNTTFNRYKKVIEELLPHVGQGIDMATTDMIDHLSQVHYQMGKDVIQLCGYMQFRIANWKTKGVSADDLVPFNGVVKNIISITALANQQLRAMFNDNQTSVETVVNALAKYAAQIDIECGAFGGFEESYNR